MPSFSESGEVKFATLITGPRHVRLGLVLADEPVEPTLVELPAIGACDHSPWDLGRLRSAVATGLAEVARRHGVVYHAREIHYVANDTPGYDLVARCAFLIGERLANEGSFIDHSG